MMTSKPGLQLFKRWFSKRKLLAPNGNIWNFDLGKLVVPRVFMDSDLLTTVSQNYDPIARIVKGIFGMDHTIDYHKVI